MVKLSLALLVGVVVWAASAKGQEAPVAAPADSPAPAPTPTVRVVLVGDSTVTEDAGWGKGFASLLADGVACINHAHGGRSSKSYRDEGWWDKAVAERADYVLLQFGHNDQPGKGPERETDPATTFRANMRRYVEEARAAGMKPILVTSLTRRNFNEDGTLRDTLGPYAEATRAVAAETGVPLVDLYARSTAVVTALGPAACEWLSPIKADGSVDTTHLNERGSDVFAVLVAAELRRVAPELAAHLKPLAKAGE